MTERIDYEAINARHPPGGGYCSAVHRWQRVLGWLGVVLALPFFIWAPLALIAPLPSMIDVFGVVGLRIPASITVAGLLLAAIGFHRF